MKRVTAAGVAIALMTSTSALAQGIKYDVNVANAAATKAAEKIGEIEGSIDFDQVPDLITKNDLVEKPVNTSYAPSAAGPKENRLPPMTSLFPELDLTVTGSINGKKVKMNNRVIWDKFDRYGNPIK